MLQVRLSTSTKSKFIYKDSVQLINELLTNVFKYAFPHNRDGNIFISFTKEGEKEFILKIEDDGVGNNSESTGFGSQLINLLVKQLGAKFSDGNDGGYWCEIIRQ